MKEKIRMILLENIPVTIMMVPYVTIKFGGKYHLAALLFGLSFFLVYAWIIYNDIKIIDRNTTDIATTGYGITDICFDNNRIIRFIVSTIYVIRFMLKSSFVIYLVSQIVIHVGLKHDVSMTAVFGVFVALCIYGSAGSFKKRNNLAHFLLGWMIVPMIVLVVLSVSRMDYLDIAHTFSGIAFSKDEVFNGAWMVLASMSSIELLLFSYGRRSVNGDSSHTVKNKRQTIYTQEIIKAVIWMIILAIGAYLFTVGMMGRSVIGNETLDRITFGLTIDYLFVAAWLIGAFYIASSYMFYAREMLISVSNINEFMLSDRAVDRNNKKIANVAIVALFIVMTAFFGLCFNIKIIRTVVINYLIYVDAFVSIALPAILIAMNKEIRKCQSRI